MRNGMSTTTTTWPTRTTSLKCANKRINFGGSTRRWGRRWRGVGSRRRGWRGRRRSWPPSWRGRATRKWGTRSRSSRWDIWWLNYLENKCFNFLNVSVVWKILFTVTRVKQKNVKIIFSLHCLCNLYMMETFNKT